MAMMFRSAEACDIVYLNSEDNHEQEKTLMQEKITEWLRAMGNVIYYHQSISGADRFWVGSIEKESNTLGYYMACKVEHRDDVIEVVKILCIKDYELFLETFDRYKLMDGC